MKAWTFVVLALCALASAKPIDLSSLREDNPFRPSAFATVISNASDYEPLV